MYVVICADGGPDIGYGHLVRTGALASELLERGHDVTYATTTPEQVAEVCPDSVKTETLPARDDPNPTREFVRDHADVTVTDSYLVDGSYQRQLREVSPLLVIADDTQHQIAADILVNGNFYASELKYKFSGEPPKQYLGTDYVLLRREIRNRTAEESPWREQPKRAIITMGGSDIAGLTPTVIRAFEGSNLHVDAIVGPGCSAEHEQEVHNAAENCTIDVCVSRNPANLVDRMVKADFAISTASSTTYELLTLGTPLVSIPVADNQEPIAKALDNRNVATVLQRGDEKAAFRNAIENYVHDSELRRKRREDGRKLVDGHGTERIAEAIVEMVNH
jgi:UDP-2,4-diacetamido-2,4,6-trideoxy-beta-L-altropyranose hydrolase